MPYQTHDTPELRVPSFFWHFLRYPSRWTTGSKAPRVEHTTTNEIEAPYRVGHALAIRLWPTNWAIVIGWWATPQAGAGIGEAEGLARALGGEVMTGMPVTQMAGWRRPAPYEDEPEELPGGVSVEDYRADA